MLIWEIYSILSSIYFLVSLLIVIGNQIRIKRTSNRYTVSIIVAARNEEDNIAECLYSLFAQDYPREFLEIIVVNDRSEDETEGIVSELIDDKPYCKLFSVDKPIDGLTGKESALTLGINASSSEIILLTDADCILPPSWVSSMVSCFSNPVGMVAGFSIPKCNDSFSCIQAVDHLFLIGVASGFAGLGIPQSCIGNNLAFRRDAYNNIGGYEAVGYTITEDVGLLQKIRAKSDYRIVFNRGKDALVKTYAAGNFSEFKKQRMRWLVGGMEVSAVMLFSLILTFGTIFLSTAALISVLSFNFNLSPIIALGLFLLSNLMIILSNKHLFDIGKILKWFIPHQLFFILYSLILGFFFLIGKRDILWKGRDYS